MFVQSQELALVLRVLILIGGQIRADVRVLLSFLAEQVLAIPVLLHERLDLVQRTHNLLQLFFLPLRLRLPLS